MTLRFLAPPVSLLCALGLSACGHDAPAPVVPSVPVAATATPTPTPATVTPLSASCDRLPAGATKYTCQDDTPGFLSDVLDAIDDLRREQPAVFSPDDENSVVNVGAYYVGLIRQLDKKGICAGFDGEELVVTTGSAYSEQYKVLTSWNAVSRRYIGTCTPAVYPVGTGALAPSPAGCSLPPSREVACGSPPTRFESAMQEAIARVLREKPQVFDYTDANPATGWPRVRDFDAYYAGVVEALGQQGFCSRFDGEEMVVKRTNEFSEHFKINLSDKWVRTGAGIYRGACYPAAF
ncbi:MAG: hypothetical protein U0599_00590 [Vicinamibacteria bacterium]